MKQSEYEALCALSRGEWVSARRIPAELLRELKDKQLLTARQHGSRIAYRAADPQEIGRLYSLVDPSTLSTRAQLVEAFGDSKIRAIRSCPGFPVNVYRPLSVELGPADESGRRPRILLGPVEGAFTFISDWQNFRIPADVLVVGVENMENFRKVSRQKHLFEGYGKGSSGRGFEAGEVAGEVALRETQTGFGVGFGSGGDGCDEGFGGGGDGCDEGFGVGFGGGGDGCDEGFGVGFGGGGDGCDGRGAPILFVSRYPQSGDLVAWLKSIPNRYLHFGDFDLAGISIFLTEFRIPIDGTPDSGGRTEFFIPDGIEELLEKGSPERYQDQVERFQTLLERLLSLAPHDTQLRHLVSLIHSHRRGYDQEGLLPPH